MLAWYKNEDFPNAFNLFCRTPQNETLLLIAIRHQLEKVADKLCEMGVDLSMADTQGNSPLWVALRSRQETIATKLVCTCV